MASTRAPRARHLIMVRVMCMILSFEDWGYGMATAGRRSGEVDDHAGVECDSVGALIRGVGTRCAGGPLMKGSVVVGSSVRASSMTVGVITAISSRPREEQTTARWVRVCGGRDAQPGGLWRRPGWRSAMWACAS